VKGPNLHLARDTSYFGRQDRGELGGRRSPEPLRNGETSGRPTTYSFCTAAIYPIVGRASSIVNIKLKEMCYTHALGTTGYGQGGHIQ